MKEIEDKFGIINAAPVMMWVQGQDDEAVLFNEAWCRFTGRTLAEELSHDWDGRDIHPTDRKQSLRNYSRHLPARTPFKHEYRLKRADGEYRWLLEAAVPYFGKDGRYAGFIGACTDITERRQAEEEIIQHLEDLKRSNEQLLYLAQYDKLTGLPNRELFRDRLRQSIARAERQTKLVALMFLDLDRFKEINDTLGHIAGDTLLVAVAGRLKHHLREVDTIARLGGDEFTIIVENLNEPSDANAVAEKITEALASPFSLEGQEYFVTASIGITICPLDGRDVDVLLKNADIAMYKAKELGRNQYHPFTVDMNTRSLERLALQSELRKAVEHDEFKLHYQPRVDTRNNQVVALEALVRWHHPERGLVPPGEFMAFAEETALILPIGEWILRTACIQNKLWQDAGLTPVKISVNISAAQLRLDNLESTIRDLLEETGLRPEYLDLEITESTLMSDTETIRACLEKLGALGLRIFIDDFGTGYSSLSYLRRFPISGLKIDRSFVMDIPADPNATAIARAIIALSRALHIEVIAEGVETEQQLEFLRAEGCHEVQGFHFSEPLPAKQAQKLLPPSTPSISS